MHRGEGERYTEGIEREKCEEIRSCIKVAFNEKVYIVWKNREKRKIKLKDKRYHCI